MNRHQTGVAVVKRKDRRAKLQVRGVLPLFCVAAMFFSGCDLPKESIAALEARLKDQASTRPKSGMLEALEVVSTARAITERAASPPDSRCALRLPEAHAYTYRFSLELEQSSVAGVDRRWVESRTLRRDDDGDLAVSMDAHFRTRRHAEGARTPQWRVVGGSSYVSDDGRAFYRRHVSADERSRLVHASSATLQALLDAVSTGWHRAEEDEVFKVGGERLVCGPVGSSDGGLSIDGGWLRRFETRANVLGGELRVLSPRSRKLEVRWQLEDGSTLAARFEDHLVDGAQPVEPPDKASVVAVERDRSLRRIEQLIEDMTRDGLVEGEPTQDFDKSTPQSDRNSP